MSLKLLYPSPCIRVPCFIYLECVVDIFLGLCVVVGKTPQGGFQVLQIILDFTCLQLALLHQVVDGVQLLDLVPGSFLAAHLAQRGHVVALEAVQVLKETQNFSKCLKTAFVQNPDKIQTGQK